MMRARQRADRTGAYMTERSGARGLALGVLGVVIVVAAWQAIGATRLFGTSVSAPTEVLEVITAPGRWGPAPLGGYGDGR